MEEEEGNRWRFRELFRMKLKNYWRRRRRRIVREREQHVEFTCFTSRFKQRFTCAELESIARLFVDVVVVVAAAVAVVVHP